MPMSAVAEVMVTLLVAGERQRGFFYLRSQPCVPAVRTAMVSEITKFVFMSSWFKSLENLFSLSFSLYLISLFHVREKRVKDKRYWASRKTLKRPVSGFDDGPHIYISP